MAEPNAKRTVIATNLKNSKWAKALKKRQGV